MIKYKLLLAPLFLVLLYNGAFAQQNLRYTQWKQDRIEEVRSEDGWLNLAGLHWLENNKNQLVIASKVLSLAGNPTDESLGYFEWNADSVWFLPSISVQQTYQLPPKILQFPEEHYGDRAMKVDKWKWSIIERDGLFGVRVRDLHHPALDQFESIPNYDYQDAWAIEAKLIPKFNEFIMITNVLGQQYEWRVMGHILFEYQGKQYELLALEESGKLWVIFSDETNLNETYPTGRYLYVDFPDKTGKLNLDFNYAYNPPCAFTSFATCPIPPKENRLDFAVSAGEKRPKEFSKH